MVLELFQNIGAKVQAVGVPEFRANISKIGNSLNTLNVNLNATRNQFLFMSFGLLAAGAMIKRFGDSMKQTFDTMVDAFASVDYQATVTGTILGLTGEQIDSTRQKMIELGRDTQWTATQAGEAMQRLAMAGLSVQETHGAAQDTLNLATIGLTDVTTAAGLAVGVYRGFNLVAEETAVVGQNVSTIVSDLAFAATHSALTVEELGEALKFTAAAAEMVGWEVESVTSGLMVAADNMVRAGIAGRAMRMSIINLGKAAGIQMGMTANTAEMLEEYGVVITNTEGNLLDLATIVDNLNMSFEDLSDTQRIVAIRQIFGARSTTMWAAMLREGGEELRQNELRMKMSAAKERLFIDYGKEWVDVMKTWRKEVQQQDASVEQVIVKLEKFGIVGEVAHDISQVLISDAEEWDKAWREASIASEITAERLSTLHGAQLLVTSSMDAMWASFGQALEVVMIPYLKLIKDLANWMSKLHPWIRMIIGVIILLGATMLPLMGKTLMLMGTFAMLTAAITALTGATGKQAIANTILQYSFTSLGVAAKVLRFAIWRMTVGFAKLTVAMGVVAIIGIVLMHFWEKEGPEAATALAGAIVILSTVIWLFGRRMIAALVVTKAHIAHSAILGAAKASETALWTLNAFAIARVNMVMWASPIFLMVGVVIALASGMRLLAGALWLVGFAWAVLNAVMYGSPLMVIVFLIGLVVIAILKLLGATSDLEDWFAGNHSLNTVVEHSVTGTGAMQEGFQNVEHSIVATRKAGRMSEAMKGGRGRPVAGPVASAVAGAGSRRNTVSNPRVENRFERIDIHSGFTEYDLDMIVGRSTKSALEEWNRSFESGEEI